MPAQPSPQQAQPSFELRIGALRLAVDRFPGRRPAQGMTADDAHLHADREKRRQRYRLRTKVLIWRAALGAAYAVGTGVITIAVHWLITLT